MLRGILCCGQLQQEREAPSKPKQLQREGVLQPNAHVAVGGRTGHLSSPGNERAAQGIRF